MASDTFGHRYDEDQPVLTCTRCGIAQAAVTEHGILCPGDRGEQRANAVAGMLAAVEFCRAMYGGLAFGIDPVQVQEVLDFIRADCERGGLDLAGSVASITVRAAEKSRVFTGVSVPEFLDELEAEIRGGMPPGPQS